MWRSFKARFFVVCTGFAFMVVGFFYHPEDSRKAFLVAEEMIRKMYWGESC